jgi:hypothetical protein
MPQYGTWLPYAGANAIRLALVLFVIAGALAFEGAALQAPLQLRRTGWLAGGLLAIIWLLAWITFGVCAVTYFHALTAAVGNFTPPASPIGPVTALSGLLGFVAILVFTWRLGWKAALVSASVGMVAAPMIFELPFDLIVMGRLYPTPPAPEAQYVLLYFLPLFLVAISSFALLTVSPLTRISRSTLLCLAAMYAVFAIWALLGFVYPSQPVPLLLNAAAKVLAFAAAATLFLP